MDLNIQPMICPCYINLWAKKLGDYRITEEKSLLEKPGGSLPPQAHCSLDLEGPTLSVFFSENRRLKPWVFTVKYGGFNMLTAMSHKVHQFVDSSSMFFGIHVICLDASPFLPSCVWLAMAQNPRYHEMSIGSLRSTQKLQTFIDVNPVLFHFPGLI